ncbi:Oxidoreductase [Coemansia sp. RSA 1722]|nr:Oxidoreductase [Coemansia sp. RSA 486]KAJ2603330.1 Oxidoreductase [Coemansia sp. RSA 1722]KAJ2707806.1 Oxidoreductase [Coemansia sp. IMI 203386]
MSSLEKEHGDKPLDDIIDTADLGNDTETEDNMEDAQAQAFNPETGEINWDCPCLGGMAQGTCGEQFKTAFSCFVYSEEEPKGMDCIDAFKAMQECFRDHPEEYAAELADDEDDEPVKSEGNDVSEENVGQKLDTE